MSSKDSFLTKLFILNVINFKRNLSYFPTIPYFDKKGMLLGIDQAEYEMKVTRALYFQYQRIRI